MAYPVLSSPPRSFYTRSNSNLANWQAERESEAQAQAQTIEQWRRHTTDFELPPHDCQTCFSHWPDDIRALEDYYYSHEPPHSQIEVRTLFQRWRSQSLLRIFAQTYQTFDFLDSSGGLVHRNLLTDTTRSDSQRLTSDVPSAFHRVPEEREAPAVPSSPFSVTTDNHAERQLYGSEWDTQHQQVDTLSQSVLQTSSTQDCSGTPDEDREERVMRTCLRIPFPQLLSLDCIPKTPLDQQPAELLTLVMLAIWESPQRRLTLREIRETLMNHFEYFSHRRGSENSWQVRTVAFTCQSFC